MSTEMFTPAIKETLSTFQALVSLGFSPSDIYFTCSEKNVPVVILTTQGIAVKIKVTVSYEGSDFLVEFREAALKWNSLLVMERKEIFLSSAIAYAGAELVYLLTKAGIVLKSEKEDSIVRQNQQKHDVVLN